MNPRVIVDVDCATGEGPLWHPEEERLYWVDIPNGLLYRYSPATERHELVFSGPPIGGFTLQADGALLLFMAKGPWASGARTRAGDGDRRDTGDARDTFQRRDR